MKINHAIAPLHRAEIKAAIRAATGQAMAANAAYEIDLTQYGIDLEGDYKREVWVRNWTKRKLPCHAALHIESALKNAIACKMNATAKQRRYERKNADLAKLAIAAGLAPQGRRK